MRPPISRSSSNPAKVLKFLLSLALLAPSLVLAASLDTARDLLNQQQYDEAALEANRYLSSHPGNTQARFIRGLALARTGQADAAISMFRELADEYPDLAEPLNNLGVLYAQQGKFELAQQAFEKAVKVNPEHGPAQENLGDVYVALARNAFEKAAGLEQNNTAVRQKRARLQALLDAPRDEEYVNTAAISGNQSTPDTLASPQPVAQPAPTQPQQQAPAPSGNQDAPVTRAANVWAQAWSDQNVSAYLNAYSGDFVPESGQSRAAWARERSQRVSAPGRIEVQLSDFNVETLSDERTIVSFLQRYRSGNYRDQERKALLMRQEGVNWKILREDTPDAVQRYARGNQSARHAQEVQPRLNSGSD